MHNPADFHKIARFLQIVNSWQFRSKLLFRTITSIVTRKSKIFVKGASVSGHLIQIAFMIEQRSWPEWLGCRGLEVEPPAVHGRDRWLWAVYVIVLSDYSHVTSVLKEG